MRPRPLGPNRYYWLAVLIVWGAVLISVMFGGAL